MWDWLFGRSAVLPGQKRRYKKKPMTLMQAFLGRPKRRKKGSWLI